MAEDKEIEVEDFATIAQTNNILGSSINGGGGGSEYVTKIQAVSGGGGDLEIHIKNLHKYIIIK